MGKRGQEADTKVVQSAKYGYGHMMETPHYYFDLSLRY